MNIQTIRDNLVNTISGKEKYLAQLNPNNPYSVEYLDEGEIMARRATIEFLKINIAELKHILADVEQLVEKDVEQSWCDNPDRMGGQFTQDEIDNANRW
jgi:hypothetical protein